MVAMTSAQRETVRSVPPFSPFQETDTNRPIALLASCHSAACAQLHVIVSRTFAEHRPNASSSSCSCGQQWPCPQFVLACAEVDW